MYNALSIAKHLEVLKREKIENLVKSRQGYLRVYESNWLAQRLLTSRIDFLPLHTHVTA